MTKTILLATMALAATSITSLAEMIYRATSWAVAARAHSAPPSRLLPFSDSTDIREIASIRLAGSEIDVHGMSAEGKLRGVKVTATGSTLAIMAAAAEAQITYTSRAVNEIAPSERLVIDSIIYAPADTSYEGGVAAAPALGESVFQAVQSPRVENLNAGTFEAAISADFMLSAVNRRFLQGSVLITLPINTFSSGTDMIRPSLTMAEPYRFTISSGTTILAAVESPSVSGVHTFIGVDSASSSNTSARPQNNNELAAPQPTLGNLTVAVPEPSAAALVVIGSVGGVLATALRRRAAPTSPCVRHYRRCRS